LRTPILILLLANLGFAAWALLIDRPAMVPAARDISRLPRLALASEPVPGAPRPGGGATPAAAAVHCVTVGPFPDLVIAAAADALLQTRGFAPVQRDEPGPQLIVSWVHVDDASAAAAARMLKKLHRGGLTEASLMPPTPAGMQRISIGVFKDEEGAEASARRVKALGLAPQITQQIQSEATYWVDINLASAAQSVSTEGLLPAAAAGAHLEIRDCPAPASSAPAAAAASSPVASAPGPK